MASFTITCPSCTRQLDDDLLNLCPHCGVGGGLLQTRYQEGRFLPLDREGIWKFANWLPVKAAPRSRDPCTVVYHSTELGRELSLNNLHIAFNGYWPERRPS